MRGPLEKTALNRVEMTASTYCGNEETIEKCIVAGSVVRFRDSGDNRKDGKYLIAAVTKWQERDWTYYEYEIVGPIKEEVGDE